MRETWEAEQKSEESVISHVISIREKMKRMTGLVRENLTKAQKNQKCWYDRNSVKREFQPKDEVLVLLPTVTNKLLAQWQGPYTIVKKLGKVNYVVDMYDRKKRHRTFHINMLRKWHTPVHTNMVAEDISEPGPDEDIAFWKEGGVAEKPRVGKELNPLQKQEVESLLGEYEDIFQDKPGRTTLAQHHIEVAQAQPVKLPPYRLPHAYRERN